MTWTVPMTAVAGSVFTASQYNTYLRDNFEEMFVAKAETTGQYPVTTGVNSVSPRTVGASAFVLTSETTTSTSFTDLATPGPSVTVDTGERALVLWQCGTANSAGASYSAFEVTGSTTMSADTVSSSSAYSLSYDGYAANQSARWGAHVLLTDLTPGSNTFTMKYKVFSGTGAWLRRQIIVVPF